MPKTNVTIIKKAADNLSSTFLVRKYDNFRNYYNNSDIGVYSSYAFSYGNGTIIFQHITIDSLICVIFNNHDDKIPALVKEVAAETYKERKDKMDKICQIILDGVYDGCNMSVVITEIEKV